MARKLANRAEMTVASAPGTGAITLNGATGRGQTFAAAGISNGDTICYVIENSDATQWEVHEDVVYSSSAPHLARTGLLASSNGGSPVSFGADAIVYIDAVASDIYGARGSTGQIQYNNANALAGASGLQTDGSKLGIGASPSYSLDVVGTDAIRVPAGTTAQRPANATALVRYNSTLGGFEGSKGASWGRIGDPSFQTLAEFQAAEIASNLQAVVILGYYAAGDEGAMLVKRVSANPTYGGFRSADRFLPNGSTDNTNGGYWIISGPDHVVTPEMFGAKRDGVTDDYAAIQGAINFIESMPLVYSIAATWGVRFTGGIYKCGTTLISKKSARYFAPAVSSLVDGGEPVVVINFPMGFGGTGSPAAYGWRFVNYALGGGGSSRIENIQLLYGDGTHNTRATAKPVNGWSIERAVEMFNCGAALWPGNGWHINGASDGAGFDSVVGFTDNSRFIRCVAFGNGYNGFFCYGQDANVSVFESCMADANLQFGFRDHAFLGNIHINPHSTGNGNGFAPGPPCVTYAGKTYSVVPVTNLAWSDFALTLPSITTPGTDPSVWALINETIDGSVVYQAWAYGTNYQPGGGWYMSNAQCLVKPYWENGQGANWVFGELHGGWKTAGWNVPGISATMAVMDGGFKYAFDNLGTFENLQVIFGNNQGGSRITTQFFGVIGTQSGEFHYDLNPDTYSLHMSYIYNQAGGWFITGQNTPVTFGWSAPMVGQFAVADLGLGINTSSPGAGMILRVRGSQPSSGNYAKGWWTFNNNPQGDGLLGWHTTVTGSPGTQLPLYGSQVPVYGASTVANLPSASVAGAGARAFVTDANSTTFLATVAGGGSNKVPVVSDGSNWKIG